MGFLYRRNRAVGQRIVDLLIPEDLQSEESELLASIREGKPISSFNTLRKHKNQQLIPVAITVSPILDSSGNVVGAAKTVRDISQQVAAETKIRELNSNLEAQVAERTAELHELNVLLGNVLRSASEVAIIATELDGTIRIFNTGAERMLGYSAGELIDKCTPASFHLAQEVVARAAELTAQLGQPIEGFRVFVYKAELEGAETREWTYVRKDGSQLPVSLVVTAMRDDQGECIGYLGIAVDLTEQKASEIALASGRDQLLLAAEVAELGIWSWNLADNVMNGNDRMYEIYGHPERPRVTGVNYEHWYSRLHPDDVDGVVTLLNQAVAGEAVYDPVFRVIRPDGSQRIVQAGAQVERDSQGAAIRVTGINRDITAQRELESRLQEAKEQADASSAAKSSFLANMSHEIRTPMNAVLGMLYLVQNTELTTRQLDYISKAESAAKSLLGLLNDILDYSKIEAGKMLLDAHAFELEQLMRDLAVVLSGNQGDKNVEVMFDLDPLLPNALFGDSQRLQQVLINLAGNALKFTQQGQVIIRVTQLLRCSDTVQVRIEVIDTGIGISPEQLQRIFEGFTQAEASTTRRFGGTGLGLVISKRLINLMGSDLQVSSEVGIGSRFWFDINLGIYEPQPLRALCPGADHPMRLLVADLNATELGAISVDVRRCRYNALVEQDAYDLPVFSPCDDIHPCAQESGDYRWVESSARAVRDAAGAVRSLVVVTHDIQAQMNEIPEPWSLITRNGIMKERLGDLLTDALRMQIMKLHGYRVEAIEFIGGEHTPRNLMIRAVKTGATADLAEQQRYEQMLSLWKVKPALAALLSR